MSKTFRYNVKDSMKDFSNSKQRRFKNARDEFAYEEYKKKKYKQPLELTGEPQEDDDYDDETYPDEPSHSLHYRKRRDAELS